MKSSHFYNNPIAYYPIQDKPIPFDSRFVKRRFLNIPCATLSFSQKLDIFPPDERDGVFPIIAVIEGGTFLGWDKADMRMALTLKGLVEDAVHLDSAIESNENNEIIFKPLRPF